MSKKDSFYFPHDSNARNDEKLLAVRLRLGAEGYGVYFMLIERLRECSGYMSVKDYNLIAFDLRVSAGIIKNVVEDFGLFEYTECGKFFYSNSLKNRMAKKDERAEKNRNTALKRWGKISDNEDIENSVSNRNANALQTQSHKEKKRIKEKVKKENVADKVSLTLSEIEKLKEKHGEEAYQWMVDKLSAYKSSSGARYKSDYAAIQNWVVDSYQEYLSRKKTPAKSKQTDKSLNELFG